MEEQLPVISVVIPMYNAEAFIENCIISVCNQTYKQIEIIIIDDGSTDNGVRLIESFAASDNRIRLYRQENAGVGRARNLGLASASGKYVCFVDIDDTIDPEMIQLLFDSAVSNQGEIVCCGFRRIMGDRCLEIIPDNDLNKQTDYLHFCFCEVSEERKKIITTVWAKLFEIELLRNNYIEFRISRHDDTPFFIEAVYYARKISFLPRALYSYYVHNNSLSNSRLTENKLYNLYLADELILNFLISHDIYSRYQHLYNRFRFGRILLYGGYNKLYVVNDGRWDRSQYALFSNYLILHKRFLLNINGNNFTAYNRKRLAIIKKSFFFMQLWYRFPHFIFRSFETYC